MLRFLRTICLALAMLAGLHATGALAQATAGDPQAALKADKTPDEWLKGARQPNWSETSTISPAMNQILARVLIDFSNQNAPGKPCDSAAANAAWYTLADAANAGGPEDFLRTIRNALLNIRKVATLGLDPSAAADAATVTGLARKFAETQKFKGLAAARKELTAFWKGKQVEVLVREAKRGACKTTLVAIWDPEHESYEITIYGDCACKPMPMWNKDRATRLGKWAVQLKGAAVLNGTAGGTMLLYPGIPVVTVFADCRCGAQPQEKVLTLPPPEPPAVAPPPRHGDTFWRNLKTNCKDCQPIIDKIRKTVAAQDDMTAEFRDAKSEYDAAVSRAERARATGDTKGEAEANAEAEAAKARLDALTGREAVLMRMLEDLYQQLKDCEAEHCQPKGGGKADCPPKKGRMPIKVGSNAKVGSKAHGKAKAAKTLGGLLGGLLGGGEGSGSGPATVPCRLKDSEQTVFTDPETGLSLKVGAKQTGKDMTVYARIAESADKGTFQGAWLETPAGELSGPRKAEICDLWGEWSLSVSWSRTTWQDGKVVKSESGGYQRAGDFSLPGMVSSDEAPQGLWKQLGFSNASHGARGLALRYPLPAEGQPYHLLLHLTRPSLDPVVSVPFDLVLVRQGKGFTFQLAPKEDCPDVAAGGACGSGAARSR